MTQTMTPSDTDNPLPRTLPDNADPAVDYTTVAERPGTLRGDACLVVQTRQAQRLVYGRRDSPDHPGIIGLVRFGMLTKRLWVSAMLDDPYADWYLLQVDETLEAGREELKRTQAEVAQLLASTQGVEIAVAHSLKPVRVPLRFANPYGYMGAYLVGDYDELVRGVLTARHVGLLDRDTAERMLSRGGRLLRRAFLLPVLWKHCALDRDDVRQQNTRAQAAAAAMGDLPQEVLDGTRRARHAPQIRKAQATNAPRGLFSSRTPSGTGPTPAPTDSDEGKPA